LLGVEEPRLLELVGGWEKNEWQVTAERAKKASDLACIDIRTWNLTKTIEETFKYGMQGHILSTRIAFISARSTN
jgi:hypothetical protein